MARGARRSKRRVMTSWKRICFQIEMKFNQIISYNKSAKIMRSLQELNRIRTEIERSCVWFRLFGDALFGSVRFGSTTASVTSTRVPCNSLELVSFTSHTQLWWTDWWTSAQLSLHRVVVNNVDIVETCSEKYRNSASASCHKHRFNVRVNIWGVISTSQSKFLCR